MTARALHLAVLAIGSLALAATVSAQQPAPAPDTQPAPQAGPTLEPASEGDLFTFDPFPRGYRGVTIDQYPDPRWYLREGIDSPYDADPRRTLVLPRPEPGIVFDLR